MNQANVPFHELVFRRTSLFLAAFVTVDLFVEVFTRWRGFGAKISGIVLLCDLIAALFLLTAGRRRGIKV